jgi:hypothetical protein
MALFGCKNETQRADQPKVNQEQWTEEQKRAFFNDSISIFRIGSVDSSNEFSYFFKKHYPDIKAKYSDAFIYAFEEPIIDTSQIDTAAHWFRLTVEPTFRLPYCLIIEKKKERASLTTKVTNGSGGSHSGTLALNIKYPLADTVYDNIVNQLKVLNFWALGRDTTCQGGMDGETWILEAIDKGRYNVISRWSPQRCGDSTTRQLAQLGLRIRERSRLEKVLAVLGHKGGM